MDIVAHGIVVLGHERRIDGERIGDVGIDGSIKSLKFPTARHLYVLPRTGVESRLPKVIQCKRGLLDKLELPRAIEADAAFGGGIDGETCNIVHLELRKGSMLRNKRSEMGGHGKPSHLCDSSVLPWFRGRRCGNGKP